MSTLPKGWVEATIADVTLPYETIDPVQSPAVEFVYIDIGSIDNQTQTISSPKTFLGRDAPSRARRIVAAGDVLFSTVRTYLRNVAFVPDEFHGQLTSTGIAVLRPSEAVNGRYLFNFIRSDRFITSISKAQDGTLYPAVKDKDVYGAILPLAPLSEQKRIITKIDRLTAYTTRAQLELNYIPQLVEKYKQLLLKKLLTMDCAEKRQTWESIPIGEVAETQLGKMLDRSKNKGEPTRYLRNMNVRWFEFELDDIFEMPMTDQDREKFDIVDGDILVCEGGEPGRSAVWRNGPTDLAFQKALIRVRPTRGCLDSSFFAYFMKHAADSGILERHATGSTIRHLPQRVLQKIELPLPPYNVQKAIVQYIDTTFFWLDSLSASCTIATNLLSKLDAAILAKAFCGDLVPQDPNDEPANVMLEKVKTLPKMTQQRYQKPAHRVEAMEEKPVNVDKNIEQVLREANDWVYAQEAFLRCGITGGASSEEIEVIYAQLRKLDIAGKLDVKAVTDDQNRKIGDLIRLKAV